MRCLKRYVARDTFTLLSLLGVDVAVRKSAGLWCGDDFDDLATYIREHQAGGYPVQHVVEISCRHCHGSAFRVTVDDEEGCALILCEGCRAETPIADSADHVEDAALEECGCPCGGEAFSVGVGYAMNADNEVRWVSLGLRCLADGRLGVYTDWKIDYAPTATVLPVAAHPGPSISSGPPQGRRDRRAGPGRAVRRAADP